MGIFLLLCILPLCCPAFGWDDAEMEVFDVVEEINENFYQVMSLTQDASLSEIKKAYRTLSKQIHPDKNDAPDAEVKFRQLVAIYEILKDDVKRGYYNRVLKEGLPDWRSPIYYYRRARKMSLLEISIILTVVISITQYLMAWGSYIDKKHSVEEFLHRKYKVKEKRKQKQEDLEVLHLIEEELQNIARPSWWNILPIQFVKLLIFLVTAGPAFVKQSIASAKEEKLRQEKLKEQEELQKKLAIEEEERKKERRLQLKQKRKEANILPDFTGEEDTSDGLRQRNVKSFEPVPVITGGPWTDEDFSTLSRLMGRYPGGTVDRWERIAASMNRTIYEVTRMSSKVMSELANRAARQPEVTEIKVKSKTRGGKQQQDGDPKSDINLGSDALWTMEQQRALEKAIKQFPKGVDQRWERIANCIDYKDKEDCMMRFKFLAERIRKKKEEAERAKEENTEVDHEDKSLLSDDKTPQIIDHTMRNDNLAEKVSIGEPKSIDNITDQGRKIL